MSGRSYRHRLALLPPLLMAGCSVPLTGTPFDLTPFGAILSAVGMLYWLAMAGALWFAAKHPKTRGNKTLAVLGVVAMFGYIPMTEGWEIYKARTRLAKAEAMFQERCKTAGEKIYRTAENVEGVLLMKVRPEGINYGDQFKLDDPYGRDLGGEGYIQSFARGFETRQSEFAPGSPPRLGYLYVEALDPKDGKRYRYTGRKRQVGKQDASAPNIQMELKRNPNYDLNIYAFVLDKVATPGPLPRYGVTYDDISTREEREYWIAGSSLRVVDLETNQVMAERIGYMIDTAQGNTSGGRSPWLLAANNACPTFFVNPNLPPNGRGSAAQRHQTEDFVERVLKPKLEN